MTEHVTHDENDQTIHCTDEWDGRPWRVHYELLERSGYHGAYTALRCWELTPDWGPVRGHWEDVQEYVREHLSQYRDETDYFRVSDGLVGKPRGGGQTWRTLPGGWKNR